MTSTTTPATPVVPAGGRLRPLGLDEVRITDGFWAQRQRVNGTATLAHIEHRLESEGWIGNFDRAADGTLPEGRRGREFSDSEIYKYLEAAAWEIGRTGEDALETRFRAVVDRVARAQEPDGYLSTRFGRPGQEPRWSHLEWGHELYCLGHLFQAAVARYRTRPDADDGLIQVARRAADLVCEVFGEGGNESICGHAEVEVGLAELGRALDEPRYTRQAQLFIERHGKHSLADIEFGRSYFQDDIPVRDATILRGHAVRANYLSAGAADVAVDTGDTELLAALQVQWQNTIARRTYITGGQGSHHQDEAFGEDWELPPDRAYSETCAGIGSIMFAWRLLLADGDPQYADLIERTLYNVVATSPNDDGRAFYYANTLHQRVPGTPAEPDETSPRASSSLRAPWFEVSCCPPNVARTLASLDAYVATADEFGVQVHQYASATIRTTLEDGRAVAFDMSTHYPEDGVVRISIVDDAPGEWTLGLRVPAWAHGASVRVTSAGETDTRDAAPGRFDVTRAFRAGDVVELHLPVTPRITWPDPRIDAIRGCVAVERGPEVLALESTDLAPLGVDDVGQIVIVPSAPPSDANGQVSATLRVRTSPSTEWPYGDADASTAGADIPIPLVPYHSWANRGPSTMRVWIPTSQPGARTIES
ncbi:glycoside hydrolase family 127 protein [Microbacterium pumilum]|uniref:Glycoside hydrolase family 127 protein n=2 Tax=Microbacterium pumilum TaxID=344165 RepID=A0ABN2RQ08_9MICO